MTLGEFSVPGSGGPRSEGNAEGAQQFPWDMDRKTCGIDQGYDPFESTVSEAPGRSTLSCLDLLHIWSDDMAGSVT